MAAVPSENTAPEIRVRSILHRLGYRFGLHRNDLPGTPDLVLSKHRTALFVHGCFWHRHEACAKGELPASNRRFWKQKLERNVARDKEVEEKLEDLNWRVVVIWECEVNSGLVADILLDRLKSRSKP